VDLHESLSRYESRGPLSPMPNPLSPALHGNNPVARQVFVPKPDTLFIVIKLQALRIACSGLRSTR